jgi:MFS family permease
LPEFRLLLASLAFSTIAGRAMVFVIGYQVFKITQSELAIGWLGLVEVIPAVSLALYGGYVADHFDRRRIVLLTDAVSILCGALFALISWRIDLVGVLPLYGVVFLAGVARGFADPAAEAFGAQVVPRELYVNASAWSSSVWQGCAMLGPFAGGLAFYLLGAVNTYMLIAVLFALAWCCIWLVSRKPLPESVEEESIFASIGAGVKFVFGNQVLVGSMALDLFAVLFGGAVALIPAFAEKILKVGSVEAGFLAAAPSAGAIVVMLISTRHPPIKRAGRNLLLCVAGFGVAMIVFALSENFWLSLLALAASGAFDGVSVVIRKSMMRMLSPDHMRGRISSVGSIFITSSNELGTFESGTAAWFLGTQRSVWLGGLVTLGIVALAAATLPKLRRLSLTDPPREPPLVD